MWQPDPMRALLIAGVGLAGGLASGLFGVGGGVVMVPLLVLAASLSQHEAHATSLAAIVPLAIVGAAAFGAAGEIDFAVAALLATGSLVGAPVGARILARVPESPLRVAFGLFTVSVGIVLLWT